MSPGVKFYFIELLTQLKRWLPVPYVETIHKLVFTMGNANWEISGFEQDLLFLRIYFLFYTESGAFLSHGFLKIMTQSQVAVCLITWIGILENYF